MDAKPRIVDPERIRYARYIAAGLLALDLLITVQLLGQNTLDTPLLIALYCLAPSIPLLTLHLLLLDRTSRFKFSVDLPYTLPLIVLSSLLSLAALIAVFWHFSWGHGVASLASVLYALIVFQLHRNKLAAVNKPQVTDPQAVEASTESNKDDG